MRLNVIDDLATGCYVFIESCTSHPGLGATHHCPKVDAQKYPKHSKIRKFQADGRVSTDTDTATHFYWVISDD